MTTTPHWPRRVVGVGGVADVNANVGADVAAQYGISIPTDIPSAAQAAFGQLPASVQSLVQSGMSTYSTLQPAIALAGQVAGGSVDPQQAIGALSAVATVFGGPIAGAAIGTAGEAIQLAGAAMQGLFDALGLYDHPPTVTFVGLTPTSSVPAGPTDSQWIHINTPTDLYNLYNKLAAEDIVGVFPNGTWELFWWFQIALNYLHPNDPECPHGPGCPPAAVGLLIERAGNYVPNAFDLYFANILRADLEAWANGNPYLPPRQLLYSAATIWNAMHSSSATTTYQPIDHGNGVLQPGYNLVSLLLGSTGAPDFFKNGVGQRALPVTVNLGAAAPTAPRRVIALHNVSSSSPTATAASASSSSKIVTTAAIATGGAVIASAIYAFVRHQTIGEVYGGIWRSLKKAVGK